MAQTFHRSTNTLARVSIFGAIFIAGAAVWLAATVYRSAYFTDVGEAREQPVMFSHKHHVNGLGIDCRYCHGSVEVSAYAGIPPTETCMSCHSLVWSDAEMLAPVRQSYSSGESLRWNRVHDLPDFVYFDHSIHVSKGVGCTTCHGQIDQMPLVWKANSLYMEWCLECHREPARYVRPVERVFDVNWRPPADQLERGRELVQQYGIADTINLTNCSICHR